MISFLADFSGRPWDSPILCPAPPRFDIGSADNGLAIDDFSLSAQGALAVPEPGSLALAGIAQLGLPGTRRRNRR